MRASIEKVVLFLPLAAIAIWLLVPAPAFAARGLASIDAARAEVNAAPHAPRPEAAVVAAAPFRDGSLPRSIHPPVPPLLAAPAAARSDRLPIALTSAPRPRFAAPLFTPEAYPHAPRSPPRAL